MHADDGALGVRLCCCSDRSERLWGADGGGGAAAGDGDGEEDPPKASVSVRGRSCPDVDVASLNPPPIRGGGGGAAPEGGAAPDGGAGTAAAAEAAPAPASATAAPDGPPVPPKQLLQGMLGDLFIDTACLLGLRDIAEGGFATVQSATLRHGNGMKQIVAVKRLKSHLITATDFNEFIKVWCGGGLDAGVVVVGM